MADIEQTPSEEGQDLENKTLDESPKGELGNEDQLTALQDQINQLTAEAATQRKLKQRAIKQVEDFKKQGTKPNDDDKQQNYKELWEQERAKREEADARARAESINSALTERLGVLGIASDKLGAALKLADKEIVEWDADTGLDKSSIDAAASMLQKDYPFFFERTISPTNPKHPANTGAGSLKEISRTDFNQLSLSEQRAKIKDGFKVTKT